MAFSDIFEESRKKLQNYFGLGRPGLGTFGQQIKPAVNPIVNFVRQNPSPFKFAQRRIQTPQVQKTIKPAVNFFRQNPTPYSFVNRNVVKPAIDYQRNQIRIANNLANRAITGINTYADRQRQDPLYQTARKIHKYNPASWGGQTATMFAKEAARDLVRLPLQTRASITGKTIKADTPLKRAILGKDIETLGQRRQYNVGELKKYGLSDKWAGRIGTLGTGLAIAGVGLDASDIARLGGKKLLTSLAKEVDPKIIKKMLPNISDNVARKIAKAKNVDEIESLLKAPKAQAPKGIKPEVAKIETPKTVGRELLAKEAGAKAPSKIQIQYALRQSPEYQEKMANIATELDMSEAGKRYFVPDETLGEGTNLKVIGQKSTFPDWVPSDLRQRKYIDKVLNSYDINTNQFIRPKGKAGELFDVMQDKVDREIKTKYTKIPVGYERVYPEEGTINEFLDAFGYNRIGTKAGGEGKLFLQKQKPIDIGVKYREEGLPPKKVKVKPLEGKVKEWQDISPMFAQMNTLDRIIERVTGKSYPRVRQILIEPLNEAVTRKTLRHKALLDDLKNTVVKKFGITNKNLSAMVQQYGEGRLSLEKLKSQTKNWRGVVEADKWFRIQYDKLLDEVNRVRASLNYDPIPRRKDYYTHFQELSKFWNNFKVSGDIDPMLVGISEYTQPKSRFNPFQLRRTGAEFTDDAIGAYERYLGPTLEQIHLSSEVQRLKGFANKLANSTIDTKNLNTFINTLREHSKMLAGKSHPIDRAIMDNFLGRKVGNIAMYLQSRLAANAIVGNVRSAVMQTAALPQSIQQQGAIRTAKGLLAELMGTVKGDDVMKISPFLQRRYTKLESTLPTLLERGQKIASVPFELIEYTTTKGIWRAAYDRVLSSGLKGKEAILEADRLTERIVAGRALGEKPLAFQSKILQLPLQFQLEVNNIVNFIRQDIGVKNPIQIAKLMASFYVFNTAYDVIFGDTPLPDPIRAMIDAGNELKSDKPAGEKAKLVAGRLGGEVLSSLPGGQTIAGIFPSDTRKKYFGDTDVGRYGTIPIVGAVSDPFYKLAFPFGGSQIKKTVQGVKAYKRGFEDTAKGAVKFPIAQTGTNLARAAVFGKYTVPEAKRYYREKLSPLGEQQSEIFKLGGGREYYNKIIDTRKANKEADKEIARIKSGKVTQAADLGGGIYQLSNGKFYVQELDDTLDSEMKVKQYLFEKEFGSNDENKAQYQLDYQRAKRNNDINKYMELSQARYNYLEEYKKVLDPTKDKKKLISIANEQDDILYYMQKYAAYGGFTKGSGGGSGKKKIPTLSMPESVTSLQRIPIRQAKKPTFSTGRISVQAPQVRKLPVKGITKEYLSKLR